MPKIVLWWCSLLLSCTAWAGDDTFFIVDKAKFQLHQCIYKDSGIEIVKTYKTTLGKALGDKLVEGDLKTPEGIYRFTTRYTQPHIKKKLGVMALYVNYPNSFDKVEGKTGFDIMLHATDDPSRLERNQDSDGCIVVSNEMVQEIEKNILLQKTLLVIYEELKPEFLKTDFKPELRAAFEKWLKAWTEKDIEGYIGSYADNFKYLAMDIKAYRDYKASLNKKYETIDVSANHVRVYYHPKYSIITFTQQYKSTFKGGRAAFTSVGTKALYFKETAGQYKIQFEDIRP